MIVSVISERLIVSVLLLHWAPTQHWAETQNWLPLTPGLALTTVTTWCLTSHQAQTIEYRFTIHCHQAQPAAARHSYNDVRSLRRSLNVVSSISFLTV